LDSRFTFSSSIKKIVPGIFPENNSSETSNFLFIIEVKVSIPVDEITEENSVF
jgi:hypothetical protein